MLTFATTFFSQIEMVYVFPQSPGFWTSFASAAQAEAQPRPVFITGFPAFFPSLPLKPPGEVRNKMAPPQNPHLFVQ